MLRKAFSFFLVDFKCDNPFSYKWYITYDYTYFYNECKEAYEKFAKQNNVGSGLFYYDGKELHKCASTTLQYKTLRKGDILYNIDDNTTYLWDGKIFQNMC